MSQTKRYERITATYMQLARPRPTPCYVVAARYADFLGYCRAQGAARDPATGRVFRTRDAAFLWVQFEQELPRDSEHGQCGPGNASVLVVTPSYSREDYPANIRRVRKLEHAAKALGYAVTRGAIRATDY